MRSLKTRLVLILLALIAVAWLASALVSYLFVSRVMLQQVDGQLAQYSDLVNYITRVFARQVDQGMPLSEPWLRGEFDTAHLSPMIIEAPAGEKMNPALNIWLEGNLIAVMADSPRFGPPTAEGYSFGEGLGTPGRWRLLTRHDEVSGLWIRVGIELEGARAAMLRMLGETLLPLSLVLPLTLGLLYYGVSRGLVPLKLLAAQIASRSPDLLDPVATDEVPEELRPLVSSLNGLLRRLAAALEGEQRFTANAAHELLTPLAAIKTEVQLCQLQLADERGGAMLARIAQRVDRATHTVEQLLTLARLDPDHHLPGVLVPMRALLGSVLADTGHLARERGLQVQIASGAEIAVRGSEEALSIMLRNLFINAFRYASQDSTVYVELRSAAGMELSIRNDCEPLPADVFERIGERFYRVPGSAGQGAGLGLSIVARIAEQHGATMAVGPEPSGRGFCVTLQFPTGASEG
jgi:signal transduction histidine kinase